MDPAKKTIDERIDAITMNVELMSEMLKDQIDENKKRDAMLARLDASLARFEVTFENQGKLLQKLTEGQLLLISLVNDHEHRINGLEQR